MSRQRMRESKAINWVAGLVALGASAVILGHYRDGSPPGIEARPHEAVGKVAAEQSLRLLKEGGKITVITRDTAAFKNPASDVLLAAFQKTLRKAHAPLASVHALQVDPLRPLEVPPGDFLQLLRAGARGDVIVSFMGPPLLNEEQRAQVGEVKPAVLAFCSLPERVDLPLLFGQGLLRAAIITRPKSLSSNQPNDLSGWFDRGFILITNAQGVAAQGP